jgi:hypothetical protein
VRLAGAYSAVQFIEQRFGGFQVGGVEALGKPVLDLGEHHARVCGELLILGKSVIRHTQASASFGPV